MAEATIFAARPRRGSSNLSKVPYLPGLDGMRALAVVAVMIYHANPQWLPGGFLGVEVFFVISGYLITLLMMNERERTGGMSVVRFYGRRARRLLPALFLMMFLVTTYSALFRPEVLGKLRGDLLAGTFYVTNWYQIWVGQGYTAAGDFAPLRHLWSLAVEEQFYLLWPLVMIFLLRKGTRPLANTARWLIVAAIAVTVVTALLFHPGRIGECSVTPDAYWTIGDRCIAKLDALYLNSITRSSGLMLGSAFAMLWRPVAIMRSPLRDRGHALDVLALIALVGLGALTWWVHLINDDATGGAFLFRGGLFVTGVATLLVIAAVTHRRAWAGKLLGNTLLLWIGTRSYGLYLYHWPIYQIIREVAGVPLSLWQFVTAMALTAVVTELSYQIVESPIRRGEVGGWFASIRYRRDPVPRQLLAAGTIVVLALATFSVYKVSTAKLQLNEIEQSLEEGSEHITSLEELIGSDGEESALPAEPTTPATTLPPDPATSDSVVDTTTTTTSTTTTTTTLPAEPRPYIAIGDSVMLGAADVLSERGYTVLAAQSRQMIDAVPIVQQLAEAGVIADPFIIHLGTNGTISKETVDALLEPLSGLKNVILINIRGNRSWTEPNNRILKEAAEARGNIWYLDWNSLSNNCTGNCFASDGIHLSADGKKYYADLIGDITGK